MGRDGGNRQKQGFREKFCLYCTGQVCNFWKGQCGSLTINYTVKSGERDSKGSFPGSETNKTSHHTRWWGDRPDRASSGPQRILSTAWLWALGLAQHEPATPPTDLLQPAPKSLSYLAGGPTNLGQSPHFVLLDRLCLTGHVRGVSYKLCFVS